MDADVIVIGAGAAGMMCASEAGRRGRRVFLIDHWKTIGERIRISGGGHCNFTNRSAGAEHYLSQNPHFCRSALARFPPAAFIAMLDRRRVPWHERQRGQLFCDRTASDVVSLLRAACDDAGVRWLQPCAAHGVSRVVPAGRDPGWRFQVVTSQGSFRCQSLVIATGGLAAPQLGASPFGYQVAEQFGLRVVPPVPALVPLALAPDSLTRLKPLAGSALDAVTRCAGDTRTGFQDRMLITHRGLSGPAILQISSYWQMQTYGGGAVHPIEIDLLPGIDAAAWLAEHRRSRGLVANLLAGRMPRRFAHEFCALIGCQKPLRDLTASELAGVARLLKGWTLMPSGTLGFALAEVTLGGIDT
ncbi:MAG: aminoacetone oxidase family FAD-binding enzyme, partial [Acidobacteria bacterium]|nr:aminoacetone oxidase family FAD-binding enzyme [Acidobacteriota bacterium]